VTSALPLDRAAKLAPTVPQPWPGTQWVGIGLVTGGPAAR
jgi:hypothetical protein